MRLRLIREPTVDGTTLGVLFVDGRFAAFSLEDAIREVAGVPVAAWKVPKATAIPAGTYRVRLTMSNRFQRILPEVLDVPGFTGVRIHAGNTAADTEGCVLLGVRRSGVALVESRPAVGALVDQMVAASGATWITIENPPTDTQVSA